VPICWNLGACNSAPGFANLCEATIRIIITLVGVIGLGSALLWLCPYWWFVPEEMKLSVPLAHPPFWIEIVTFPIALLVLRVAAHYRRVVAEVFPYNVVTMVLWRFRHFVFATEGAAALAIIYLLSPLVGVDRPPPSLTAALFGLLAFNGWLRILKRTFVDRRTPVDSLESVDDVIVRGLAPSAEEVLSADPRPPILGLRSFDAEKSRGVGFGRFSYIDFVHVRGTYLFANRQLDPLSSRNVRRLLFSSNRSQRDFQSLAAQYFSAYGPYVALARRGESLEDMDLGAAKLHLDDDQEWQPTVIEMLERSAAIVIEADHSPSLVWELQQVVLRVDARKVLLVLPTTRRGYASFLSHVRDIFPKPLPARRPDSRLLMFADDWSPVALDNPTFILSDAVEPFRNRLGLVPSVKTPRSAPRGA
jgi:hypothetical protein